MCDAHSLDVATLNLLPPCCIVVLHTPLGYLGAQVWCNGQYHTVADPWMQCVDGIVDGIVSLTNPIGSTPV